MKFILHFILLSLSGILLFPDVYAALAFGLTLTILLQLILKSNESFMFREWALFLYASNYLLSPAITYQLNPDLVKYGMKINSDAYFSLAFPGFLLFAVGIFSIPNRLFKPEFKKVNQAAVMNERFLLQTTITGIFLRIFSDFFPGELGFFVYLLSMMRFVGAFSLFATNTKKYTWLVLLTLLIELFYGFRGGMYHDAIMWVLFFALFFVYTSKPTLRIKLIGASSLILLVLFVQAIKGAYREQVWTDGKEASLETISSVGSTKANSESLIGEENLLSSLNRGNQAWIFASTVNRMDGYKDFQGMTNVNKYMEAALLPRFLAPNKLESGNKEIFNSFSGHIINEGTSMGLGIFADGYIAYGAWGVYTFGFVLGMIFSLTFKLVERWTKISPFYVLLLLPMLNYAVRPDCELQTTINHLVKSIVVFGALVYFTRKRFTLDSAENQRKMLHLNLMK
ncbi:MAG: hypothetical protein WCH03_04875 [Flavobacteriia bacterium]